jgi:hypothetical protein
MFSPVVPWIGISQIVISITPPVYRCPVNLNSQMHSKKEGTKFVRVSLRFDPIETLPSHHARRWQTHRLGRWAINRRKAVKYSQTA